MSSNNNNTRAQEEEKILWSSVSRNGTILVEAGEDPFDGLVSETARGILAKNVTPGWEYFTLRNNNNNKGSPKLKAVKFHVFEHQFGGEEEGQDSWGDLGEHQDQQPPLVWVFAAVYNGNAWDNNPKDSLPDVQAFLQKIVGLTDMPRLCDPAWRTGTQLACQRSFAPTLLQRMQEVTYLGQMARLNQSVQDTTNLMQSNITAILDREEQLHQLDEKTNRLQDMAAAFKKKTKSVRRRMMLQNAKHGVILGTAITTGVAVVVVPPVLALL